MKKKTRKLEIEKEQSNTGVAFEIHDDACPFYADKACNCTPTRIKITDAQIEEIFRQMGLQTVEEGVDQGLCGSRRRSGRGKS